MAIPDNYLMVLPFLGLECWAVLTRFRRLKLQLCTLGGAWFVWWPHLTVLSLLDYAITVGGGTGELYGFQELVVRQMPCVLSSVLATPPPLESLIADWCFFFFILLDLERHNTIRLFV